MKRNDMIGMGASVLLHALLILAFGFLTSGAREPETLGFIEVEFGPVAQGRPVQRAVENRPSTADKKPDPQPQPPTKTAPPKEAKPVNLPKQAQQVADPDKVKTPETETISPERRDTPSGARTTDPQPDSQPVKPLGGGSTEGETGTSEGRSGAGSDNEKSAPYQIEGLNRSLLNSVLPAYREKVNANVQVRITVDPQGRVTGVVPLRKGSPALDQAVMDAVKRWRFNPLPPNVPPVNQIGTVTFRFRLE